LVLTFFLTITVTRVLARVPHLVDPLHVRLPHHLSL
jgi:hypothetical protein